MSCDRATPNLAPAPTRLETALVRFSASTNDLHRAIDLAAAGQTTEALAHLRVASLAPQNLRLETLSPGELASLGDADRAEAAQIIELRGLASRKLVGALIDDVTSRTANGDTAGAEETCAIIHAIVTANRTSPMAFVRQWATATQESALQVCR